MSEFDLKTIVSHVTKNPLLDASRYKVTITGPLQIDKSITFNCHTCDIPGHNIGTFSHSVIGPMRKIPNEEIYDDLSTTFYNNKYIDELKLIDRWIKMIGGNSSWRMAYYNDIVGEMQIDIYDLQENLTSTVKIFEVYPMQVSETQLSYTSELPSNITVNWVYHSFEIESKV